MASWLRCASLALLSITGASLHAGVYKWVDEQGKVHYGDRPESAQSQQLQIQSAPPPDPDAVERMERSQRMLNEYSDDQAEQKKKREAREQEEARRKANCELARKRLDDYEHASTLYVTDPNGERRYMNEDEQKKALDISRAEVKKWCDT